MRATCATCPDAGGRTEPAQAPRSRFSRRQRTALAGALLIALLFTALGAWQIGRRAEKHALIARVNARVGAAPVDPPARSRWLEVDAAHDAYRHLRLVGRWLPGATTRVKAVTRLGTGCWVLTPLQQIDANVVLVNRGFLGDPASEAVSPCAPAVPPPEPPAGPVDLTGLLRLSEPVGGFLRRNDPHSDRWFSRDVAAIAAARGLRSVAPFFVDADANPSTRPARPGEPVGGLTVVSFRDDHAVYALTWFTLAGLAGFAAWQLARGRFERAAG